MSYLVHEQLSTYPAVYNLVRKTGWCNVLNITQNILRNFWPPSQKLKIYWTFTTVILYVTIIKIRSMTQHLKFHNNKFKYFRIIDVHFLPCGQSLAHFFTHKKRNKFTMTNIVTNQNYLFKSKYTFVDQADDYYRSDY